MTISITLTGKDRPVLFYRTLCSLAANDLEGWRFVIRIEPGPKSQSFAEIVSQLLPRDRVDFRINDQVAGIRDNPLRAISAAFDEGSSLNLCLEEDLILAPDATRMALWYLEHHRPNWLCLSLLAGPCASAGMLSDPRYPTLLFEGRSFNSLGFAVRREEWIRLVEPAWRGVGKTHLKDFASWRLNWGWDWAVYGVLAVDDTLRTVQPALARANHTGRIGHYARPEFHDLAFADLPISTACVESFALPPHADLPRDIRVQAQLHAEMTDMRLHLEGVSRAAQSGLVDRLTGAVRPSRRTARPTIQPVKHRI